MIPMANLQTFDLVARKFTTGYFGGDGYVMVFLFVYPLKRDTDNKMSMLVRESPYTVFWELRQQTDDPNEEDVCGYKLIQNGAATQPVSASQDEFIRMTIDSLYGKGLKENTQFREVTLSR